MMYRSFLAFSILFTCTPKKTYAVSLRGLVGTMGDAEEEMIAEANAADHDHHTRRLVSSPISSECDYNSAPPYYVSPSGKDNSNGGRGLSPANPFKTIQFAVNQRQPCQTIYVMAGTYRNEKFGSGKTHTKKIVNLNNVHDIKILNYPNDRPILEFDGPGAFIGGSAANPISNIEIAGLEIVGQNAGITFEEAMADRLVGTKRFTGRGIAIWGGYNLYFHDLLVHHCPGSGIRVNRGDYVTIANNVVHSNTWWSQSAESAIVLAESKHIDDINAIKMIITGNVVYDNVNKIPYYNPTYAWDYTPLGGGKDCSKHTACEEGLVEGCPWTCRYGKKSQDYIIDGQGVYVTRNNKTYMYGQMELSYNTCYRNGINGLVFHRTDRGLVKQNKIYDNGVVPRLDRPEPVVEDWHSGCAGKSRQPYSGLVLNNAKSVKLWSNRVTARYYDDYAFTQVADGPPEPLLAGGNNKACRGLVNIDPATAVKIIEDDESICMI